MSDQAPAPDDWDWWTRALADPQRIGDASLMLYADSPEVGFFRVRSKKQDRWVPVAFFKDDAGNWQAERDGKPVDPDRIGELWNWACRYPVAYDAYERAIAGDGWIDEPEHGIGHNLPTDDIDERERLWLEFQGERDQALEILKGPISDQASADRAAIWAKRLSSIAAKADELHDVEKRPFLDGGKAVDNKWRDVREEPAALAKQLKRHQEAWLREQDRREKERQRTAEAEAARLRAEAMAAAKAADESASGPSAAAALADAGKLVSAAMEAERLAEARPVSAGRTGARVSLKTYTFARINDWQALFTEIRERDEVKTLFQSIADRAAKAGVALPGCSIEQEKRAV